MWPFISKIISGTALIAVLAACAPVSSGSDPIQSMAPAAKVKQHRSSCSVAKEAFLTGTLADRNKALKTLRNDRKAPDTARQYARFWLVRDKGNAQLRDMDESLIVTSCDLGNL